jgi:hypothetical protein
MKDEKFTVGQKLWFVPSDTRWNKAYEVEIKTIGRKWLTLKNDRRVDKETLRVDGGNYSSLGRCYLSQEEYEKETALIDAWRELEKRISKQYWTPSPKSPKLTIEALRQAEKLLFPE